MIANSSGFSEAPPTKAPSISLSFKISLQLLLFILPPYRIFLSSPQNSLIAFDTS
jgi:hypothetical protein